MVSMDTNRPATDSPESATPDSLANRYGRSQSSSKLSSEKKRRWGIIAAVIALILAVLMTMWWSFSSTADKLEWKDVGFNIESASEASVRFQLTKEPEATVICTVQVLSEDYAISGWETVVVGPNEESSRPSDDTQYYDVDLRTDHLGTNGGINDCWYSDDAPSDISYFGNNDIDDDSD